MDWCKLHLLYSRPQLLLDKIIIINIEQYLGRYLVWFMKNFKNIYDTTIVWTIIIMDNILNKIFCLAYDLGI